MVTAMMLAAMLAAQSDPPREARATAESFLAAARDGQVAAARRLLAPGTPVQPWVGTGTRWFDDAALERFAVMLRTCADPVFDVRPPRSLGNATERPLLVASLTCPNRGGRALTIRFRFGRGQLIDNVTYGLDSRISEAEAGQPRRPGGPTQPPVTDRERDAFRAALDAGSVAAIHAVVGPRVLRIEAMDNFVASSPEALAAAIRGCFVFSADRVYASPDMFFEVVCPGGPAGQRLGPAEDPGFGLKLWHRPEGLAVYFQPVGVQVRPREAMLPQPAPRPASAQPPPAPAKPAAQGQPIAAERQATVFLDRLEAGDLAGARAALPRNVRLGRHDFAEPLDWFRAVTVGCTRGDMTISQFSWLDRPARPRPAERPTGLSTDRLRTHMIFMPGVQPADIGHLALSSNWDCPGEREDPVIYFYLLNDQIVRVAYDRQPMSAPAS